MHYEEFTQQDEPSDHVVNCFEMDGSKDEDKVHRNNAIHIVPASQTPSLGASSTRPPEKQLSTLNSSKPNILYTDRAADVMFYDELDNSSQHQQMKVLGDEL